jgi:hypothetical protein
MGACADREVYFEKESVKELRAKMVLEYLAEYEESKKTRGSSAGPRSRPKKKPKNKLDFKKKKKNSFGLEELKLESLDSSIISKNSEISLKKKNQIDTKDNTKGSVSQASLPKKLISDYALNLADKNNKELNLKVNEDTISNKKIPDINEQNEKLLVKFKDDVDIFQVGSPKENQFQRVKSLKIHKIESSHLKIDENSDSYRSSPGKFVFGPKDELYKFPDTKDLNFDLSEIAPDKNLEKDLGGDFLYFFKPNDEKDYADANEMSVVTNNIELRESTNSYELENEAIGVKLPDVKPIELAITPGFSDLIVPSRSQVLIEPYPYEDETPLKKFFSIQAPLTLKASSIESEPFQPLIIPKEIIINEYNNRPASPRTESSRPRFREIKSALIISSNDLIIPNPPVPNSKIANPFKLADGYKESNSPLRTETFSPELQINESIIAINIEENKNLNESIDQESNNSPLTETPELNIYNKFNPIIINDPSTSVIQKIQLLETPESDFPEPSSKKFLIYQNSQDDYINSEQSFRASPDLANQKKLNTSFNPLDIRTSLSSPLIQPKTKTRYFRKSPQRLPTALYHKNLKGKLTTEEELNYNKY